MSKKIILSKPIKVGEEEFASLELREPTVSDVTDIGYPFTMIETDNGASLQVNPKIILRYASKLGAVPPSSLSSISLSDLSRLSAVIMGFFGDETETSQI